MKRNRDVRLTIVRVLQDSGKGLILTHIAKRAKIAHQLIDYHLEQMIKDGIIYLYEEDDRKYYLLQPIFYDEDWLEALSTLIIPFIEAMSQPNMIVYDQVEVGIPREKVVVEILTTFFKRFEEEIGKVKTA